jgi:hypothetical protein
MVFTYRLKRAEFITNPIARQTEMMTRFIPDCTSLGGEGWRSIPQCLQKWSTALIGELQLRQVFNSTLSIPRTEWLVACYA